VVIEEVFGRARGLADREKTVGDVFHRLIFSLLGTGNGYLLGRVDVFVGESLRRLLDGTVRVGSFNLHGLEVIIKIAT